MEKTFYEIRKSSFQIKLHSVLSAVDEADIVNAATGADSEPQIIERFDTKDEAVAAFNSKHAKEAGVWMTDGYPSGKSLYGDLVYIEENTYEIDEDGDMGWCSGGDIVQYTI